MLAVYGFGVLAVLLGIFAYTFEVSVVRKTKLHLTEIAIGFGLVAVACALWSVASYYNNISFLQLAMVVGDALLLGATMAVLDSFFGLSKYRELYLIGSAVVVLYLILQRASVAPPAAYITHGVLVFNAEMGVNVITAILIAGAWLPASFMVSKVVSEELERRDLWPVLGVLYGLVAVSMLVLMVAKSELVIILAMVLSGVCLVALAAANIMAGHVMDAKARKPEHLHVSRHRHKKD